ncbi:MAG TPA: GAF domain-containing protein [Aggregatilinea sp.]|uniref:GAF domain-containing protein n=1 Tax=Aggregatilinea sp. TaxID=2806333 RepID=UPI002C380C37|nr:GAF domain-containing protein [Aggregatilinea sp.]HML22235.1 GAF domain-containing protein [Aggregatilinea sp.]
MDSTLIVVMVVGATLAVGGFVFGLLTGYWRGRARGIALATNERPSPELDVIAGAGNAILSVPLRVDPLCEVIYQQATRIVDTRNFQIGLFDNGDYEIKVWLKAAQRLPAQRFVNVASEGIVGWIKRTGTGLLVRDFQREWETLPARPSHYSIKPARSAIFAPLISGGDVLGVIAVQSDLPDSFNDEDMRLLTLLANQASSAIRNAQMFEAAQEQARQLQLINDVSRQLTAIQPLPDLFRQIVTLLHDAFGYYAVSIFIWDEKSDTIQLRASSHADFIANEFSITPDQGLVGWAATQQQPALAPNVSDDSRFMPTVTLVETKSEVCVPLIVQQRVMGVLDVQSDELDAFGSADMFMLEALAGQLALAIQEAESYDAERRQTERVNAMTEVARALVSILDIDDLLDEVVDLVTDHLGYDRVHLFLRVGERLAFRSGSGAHSGKWALEKLSYALDGKGMIPLAAREGRPKISGNVREEAAYIPGPGREDTQSEMAVPIRMGPHLLGVFDIQSPEPDAFTEEDSLLIQALADTVAIALRNASLFANEQRRRMLSETLRELSTVLGSSLDLNSVLDGILVGLERVVDYTAGVILLRDTENDCYQASAAQGDLVGSDSSIWNETIREDGISEAQLIDLLHRMYTHAPDENAAHDEILVPLTVAGESIGYLLIERIGPDRFTPEDKEIISTFANQAAVAITNAQLYMAQREEAWVSTALLQVAEATARATTLDEVLSTVARITPLLVGVEWSAVMLADQPSVFRVVEIAGTRPELAAAFNKFSVTPLTWPPLAEISTTGQPVLIDGSTPKPENLPVDINIGQGVMLPLFAKGELMGLILIGQGDDTEPMTERKIELVSGIANQAALAIESAQLFAAQQEEAWVTTALLQVAEAVNTQIDADQSLETIVRLTPLLVGVERCGVMKWDADNMCFIGGPAWGLSPEHKANFARVDLPVDAGPFLVQLTETSDPVSAGVGGDRPLLPVLQNLFESPALLGLPLIARGHLVGAMLVDHPALGGSIDQRRLNILTGIAHQTALALENARLQAEATAAERIERELEVARGIQTSFLPDTTPREPGWDVSAFYRAARQVGGDFYDFFPLDEHKWAVVVADVADKGVPAALFMALCRTLLRAVGTNRRTPRETLVRVNDLLLNDNRAELFVTIWYGIWDASTGCLTYCSAGHNPPLLVHADGRAEQLIARGIALGVVPSIRLDEKDITLRPGELVALYTDGITEAIRSDKSAFGVAGLQSALVAYRNRPAKDVGKRVLDAVDTFVLGEPQFDDITLVIIKCVEAEPDALDTDTP